MRLSVQIEFDKTLDLETHKSSTVVGRSNTCDLIISHKVISREHCKIDHTDERFFITDLGSANGVFIDGKRIPPHVKTLYLPTSLLRLGGLECELSDKGPEGENNTVGDTVVSRTKDFTATVRVARLDLNRPPVTLELEKKSSSNRPKNPISSARQVAPKKINLAFPIIVVVFLLVILVISWYLNFWQF